MFHVKKEREKIVIRPKTKNIILVSSYMLAILIVSIVVFTTAKTENYFGGGNGSEDNPFVINKAEHLIEFSNYINDEEKYEKFHNKNFILRDDIDMVGQDFSPIGIEHPFTGKFDGNSKSISNLNINQKNNVGLFGILAGEIKDLKILNSNFVSNSSIGILAGVTNESSSINNIYIEGCSVYGLSDVNENFQSSGGFNVGGLIGKSNGSLISNIEIHETKIKGHHNVGGLVGEANNLTIINKANVDDETNIFYTFAYEYDSDFSNINFGADIGLNNGANLIDVVANAKINDHVFEVDNPNQFRGFIESINNFETYSQEYVCNINSDFEMENINWDDVILSIRNNKLTIDGKGHTINHLTISKTGDVGLFSRLDVNANAGGKFYLKNLSINEANLEGTTNDDLARVSAFIGNAGNFNFENCHVKNSIFKSDKYIGAFVGYDADGSGSSPYNLNCSISNCSFISTNEDNTVSISFGGFCGYTQTPHILERFNSSEIVFTTSGKEKATHLGLYYGTVNCDLHLINCFHFFD